MVELDRYDLAILGELQRDGHVSNSALSEIVHLSPSQVSRRIQRLEGLRVIDQYTVLLKLAAVGIGVIAFTSVSLDRHGELEAGAFDEEVRGLPEVLECYSLTGEQDYLLRIVAPDLASF